MALEKPHLWEAAAYEALKLSIPAARIVGIVLQAKGYLFIGVRCCI